LCQYVHSKVGERGIVYQFIILPHIGEIKGCFNILEFAECALWRLLSIIKEEDHESSRATDSLFVIHDNGCLGIFLIVLNEVVECSVNGIFLAHA
jgi:hypothetical protein